MENVVIETVIFKRDGQKWVDSDIYSRQCGVLFSLIHFLCLYMPIEYANCQIEESLSPATGGLYRPESSDSAETALQAKTISSFRS